MKQKYLTLAVTSTLLLAGAGCGTVETPVQVNSKPAEVPSNSSSTLDTTIVDTTTSTEKENSTSSTVSLELTGKALGRGMVQFSWTLPEGTKNPRSFHLVRGQNENPTQPPSNWYKVDGKFRSSIWAKLAKGEQHFRICTWETTKCEVYSNDVLVDVK